MIVKSKHASNFTVVPNDIFKQGLTVEAIGLLTFLLSLPHDWVVYKTTLHTHFNGMGDKKLDRVFKELQKSGYILSTMERDSKGKMSYSHVVYDKPFNGEPLPPQRGVDKPGTDKPYTVDPLAAKEVLLSTNKQRTNITKEAYTNNIKIGSASFLDIAAYINTAGQSIYKAVTANLKEKGITHDEFLADLKNEYPIYAFTDENHFTNALKRRIAFLEANKKKVARRDKNNDGNRGMVY